MNTFRIRNLATDYRFQIDADAFPDKLEPEWGFPDCEVTERIVSVDALGVQTEVWVPVNVT